MKYLCPDCGAVMNVTQEEADSERSSEQWFLSVACMCGFHMTDAELAWEMLVEVDA